ncbi:glycosyltransferase [Rhodospirillaceae bacterium SYSU D60014]|uniref:glycosyltransferase n=1 Tax=Virgifigura deserti TaxID=2268457 RepID=UPI000E66EDC6
MAEPQVSVLMSAYNAEAHLHEAVESILRQTFTDFEFIIIDDGSTDATPAILASHADSRIRILTNRRNIGLTASLNRGLAACRGAYIARQDADDRSLPQRLEKQVRWLGEHPEVALIGTAYRAFDEARGIDAIHRPPATDGAIRWHMLFHNAFCHSSVMFRAEATGRHGSGYDETLPFAQDYELWQRLLQSGRGANLPDPLLEHRVHGDAITSTRFAEQQAVADEIARRQIARLLGEDRMGALDVRRLRSWFQRLPDDLSRRDLRDVAIFFDLLDRLAAAERIGDDELATLRRALQVRFARALGLPMVILARRARFLRGDGALWDWLRSHLPFRLRNAVRADMPR